MVILQLLGLGCLLGLTVLLIGGEYALRDETDEPALRHFKERNGL